MGPYESPTFLNRKDKIAFGMTMSQLGIGIGLVMGLLLFWLLLPVHVIVQLGGFLVNLIAVLVIMTVRISGVRIPAYLFRAFSMWLRRPAYVAVADLAINQLPDFDAIDAPLGTAAADGAVAAESGAVALDEFGEPVEVPPKGWRKITFLLRRLTGLLGRRAKDQETRYQVKAQADGVAAEAIVGGRQQLRSLMRELRDLLPRFRR